uniref:Uncharacterized protein n=1 Tax=uncultured bacterium BLR12 TaxID=506514 RepID=C0INE8_9BACT|nr:hypothetical protein AKSOIL_0219 [uncultured bacterium BLR12]
MFFYPFNILPSPHRRPGINTINTIIKFVPPITRSPSTALPGRLLSNFYTNHHENYFSVFTLYRFTDHHIFH